MSDGTHVDEMPDSARLVLFLVVILTGILLVASQFYAPDMVVMQTLQVLAIAVVVIGMSIIWYLTER